MPLATLIIPTCNRPADLRRCLELLAPQLPADGSVELIVTDDGKDEQACEIIAQVLPLAKWLRGPRRGPASNRNAAAKTASGGWLIFLDDDCQPTANYLAAYLVGIREAPRTSGIIEGSTRRDPTPPSLLWEAPETLRFHGHLTCSCNFAIRADIFHAMDGFDHRYAGGVYAEDTDFSARLSRAGYQMTFEPRAMVVHPLRPIPGAAKLAKRWEGKVIFAFDQGASALTVAWRLPWHVLRVIQSRFRHQRLSLENLRAAFRFAGEWLLVVLHTPGWVKKWSTAPRSSFWEIGRGRVPKFGF